jgi:hypothetical protein
VEALEEKKEKKKFDPNYLKGLSGSDAAKRKKELERGEKTDTDDPNAYKDSKFKTDFTPSGERKKTKKSIHTKRFEKMYGESLEDIDDLLEEDLELDLDMDLLREFVEEVLTEKKRSNVTASLKNKAEKTGAPMGALRAIYNKGLAAWRTGHRPGASAHQWAMARVNSVLTGGPARKVDAAQWKQIQKSRGKKRKSKKK